MYACGHPLPLVMLDAGTARGPVRKPSKFRMSFKVRARSLQCSPACVQMPGSDPPRRSVSMRRTSEANLAPPLARRHSKSKSLESGLSVHKQPSGDAAEHALQRRESIIRDCRDPASMPEPADAANDHAPSELAPLKSLLDLPCFAPTLLRARIAAAVLHRRRPVAARPLNLP